MQPLIPATANEREHAIVDRVIASLSLCFGLLGAAALVVWVVAGNGGYGWIALVAFVGGAVIKPPVIGRYVGETPSSRVARLIGAAGLMLCGVVVVWLRYCSAF